MTGEIGIGFDSINPLRACAASCRACVCVCVRAYVHVCVCVLLVFWHQAHLDTKIDEKH